MHGLNSTYFYYGTDDLYLNYFRKFVKPGGQIGIVIPGLVQDFDGAVPEHLTRKQESGGTFWDAGGDCWGFHTQQWWGHLWARTGLVDVELTETMRDGWRVWVEFDKALTVAGKNIFPSDGEALRADAGQYIALIRMIARRKESPS